MASKSFVPFGNFMTSDSSCAVAVCRLALQYPPNTNGFGNWERLSTGDVGPGSIPIKLGG
jgi:hypothetical protein